MVAKAGGLVWGVKEVGTTEVEGGFVFWTNLLPITGGEQRAAFQAGSGASCVSAGWRGGHIRGLVRRNVEAGGTAEQGADKAKHIGALQLHPQCPADPASSKQVTE